MASAAEQMAANLSWGTFGKAKDLQSRILFALGLLIVYRIGTYIPVPGVDAARLREFFDQQSAGIGGMLNMFTGGAVGRMAIFALGIMPYISASIIVQLMTSMVPSLQALKKEGESGRKKINQYTRYGTVFLAFFQAYGLAVGLEAEGMAHDPGWYLPHRRDHHAGRRHDVPDVARRADHRARHRQRHLAHHLHRHRRRAARRARPVPHPGPHRRAQPRRHRRHHGDGGGGDRLRGLHGARAAQDPHPVPQAPGRHEGLRRRKLEPAGQGQPGRRHPSDLRLVAPAAAGDHHHLLRHQRRHEFRGS